MAKLAICHSKMAMPVGSGLHDRAEDEEHHNDARERGDQRPVDGLVGGAAALHIADRQADPVQHQHRGHECRRRERAGVLAVAPFDAPLLGVVFRFVVYFSPAGKAGTGGPAPLQRYVARPDFSPIRR
jgi:hypothetical protein